MIKDVSVRELLRNPKVFLSPQNFRLTKYGRPILYISITNIDDLNKVEKISKPPIIMSDKVTDIVKDSSIKSLMSDKCKHQGCERGGGYHYGYCTLHWKEHGQPIPIPDSP